MALEAEKRLLQVGKHSGKTNGEKTRSTWPSAKKVAKKAAGETRQKTNNNTRLEWPDTTTTDRGKSPRNCGTNNKNQPAVKRQALTIFRHTRELVLLSLKNKIKKRERTDREVVSESTLTRSSSRIGKRNPRRNYNNNKSTTHRERYSISCVCFALFCFFFSVGIRKFSVLVCLISMFYFYHPGRQAAAQCTRGRPLIRCVSLLRLDGNQGRETVAMMAMFAVIVAASTSSSGSSACSAAGRNASRKGYNGHWDGRSHTAAHSGHSSVCIQMARWSTVRMFELETFWNRLRFWRWWFAEPAPKGRQRTRAVARQAAAATASAATAATAATSDRFVPLHLANDAHHDQDDHDHDAIDFD